MLKISRLVAVAFAALAVAVASPAKAGPIISTETFVFTGDCQDCARAANKPVFFVTADLTVQNYVQGTSFSSSNFVSFTYNGSNLLSAFTITDANLSGLIPLDLPAFADVTIQEKVSPFDGFQSLTDGTWGAGPLSDMGIDGRWSVPEPPSLALLVVSLLGFGFLLRRRARPTPS